MHPNVKIKRFCVVLTPTDLFCLLSRPCIPFLFGVRAETVYFT